MTRAIESPAAAVQPRVEPLLWSAMDVANALGMKRSTVYAMILAGSFAPTKIHCGKSVRFIREEVIAWVVAKCPPASRWQWDGGCE